MYCFHASPSESSDPMTVPTTRPIVSHLLCVPCHVAKFRIFTVSRAIFKTCLGKFPLGDSLTRQKNSHHDRHSRLAKGHEASTCNKDIKGRREATGTDQFSLDPICKEFETHRIIAPKPNMEVAAMIKGFGLSIVDKPLYCGVQSETNLSLAFATYLSLFTRG